MAKKKRAKTQGRTSGRKLTPSIRKAGAGARAKARTAVGRRKTAGAKTPRRKATRKKSTNPLRPGKRQAKRKRASTSRRAAASRKRVGTSRKRTTAQRKGATSRKRAAASRKRGGGSVSRKPAVSRQTRPSTSRKLSTSPKPGKGREETLAQTPEAGRTVRGRTNPQATRRSTGTPAGAGSVRHVPGLDRERKRLRELEEAVQGPPSSLDMDRHASAARSGRLHFQETLDNHHETSPAMTGGDVDADWQDAYAAGDEAPGGDNPTPDQDRVDDIGKALGVTYEDNEELKASDKIAERDRHRWELDPASSDDYNDRD